jgi:MOSC domain-containing protein
MVNIDPSSSNSDPRVLSAVAMERDARLGVYGTVVEPGKIAVGDPVFREISI